LIRNEREAKRSRKGTIFSNTPGGTVNKATAPTLEPMMEMMMSFLYS